MRPTTERIIERVPSFYKTWTDKSLLRKFLESFAKTLNETERDLFRIMRGHWIDSAEGQDLERIAAIYNIQRQVDESDQTLRRRAKRAIQEFKGGGTRAAIERAVRDLILPFEGGVELVEFPPTPISFQVEVTSGETWRASSLA